jgi:hypothetical protein
MSETRYFANNLGMWPIPRRHTSQHRRRGGRPVLQRANKKRKSRWCEVEHRVIDWAARSSFTEEFEVVIMIESVTEEMHGSN